MTIAFALRWGVAFVGVYSTGHGSPFLGKTFQVQGVHWWMALIRGHNSEESRVVALYHFCKDARNKLVLACIFV